MKRDLLHIIAHLSKSSDQTFTIYISVSGYLSKHIYVFPVDFKDSFQKL